MDCVVESWDLVAVFAVHFVRHTLVIVIHFKGFFRLGGVGGAFFNAAFKREPP